MIDSSKPKKKLLVVFDTYQDYQTILDFATTLARHHQAQLSALFVEDINLFHMAGLPFAREINRITSHSQPIDTRWFSQHMEKQVIQIRQLLTHVKTQSKLDVSLKVVRGHYLSEALAAATESDWLLLNRGGHWQAGQIRSIRKKVFVSPVWVVFDGSPASERSLFIAEELIKNKLTELNIILKADSRDTAAKLEQQARQILGDFFVRTHFFIAEKNDLSSILQCILQRGCSIIILNLDRQNELIASQEAALFSGQVDCPVLLVS